MASTSQRVIAPPPFNVAIAGPDGRVSSIWADWFRQTWIRNGKEIALTNVELENIQQQDLEGILADILAIEALNVVQGINITRLLADVEGLRLAPLP